MEVVKEVRQTLVVRLPVSSQYVMLHSVSEACIRGSITQSDEMTQ